MAASAPSQTSRAITWVVVTWVVVMPQDWQPIAPGGLNEWELALVPAHWTRRVPAERGVQACVSRDSPRQRGVRRRSAGGGALRVVVVGLHPRHQGAQLSPGLLDWVLLSLSP